MELDYALVKFNNINIHTREGVKLRGYFANKYKEQELMHNHIEDKLIFSYPKVQYKIIQNNPIICGILEGAKIVSKVAVETDELNLSGKVYEAFEKEIIRKKVEFGLYNDYIEYEFLTPWIALNQNNIERYRVAKQIEREELMKKILIGNIISLSKGMEYTVEDTVYSWVDLKETIVKFKNIEMTAFKGRFRTNFNIPDYLGLGKAVSRGFGTILRVK
ncbi:MAG: CRISPR-associated endonuclease Cas6 [Lutisporaceae bacterium]